MTFKSHLVQQPYNDQKYLQLDQVAQNLLQPDLECFPGGSLMSIAGHFAFGEV